MEYLMTYGWAILIVIIVAAALFALGVFNPATYTQSTATGFTGFQVPTGGWQLNSGGQLTLMVSNMAGANIQITNVSATYAGTVAYNATASGTIAPGSSYTILITGLPAATTGTSYSVDAIVTYTNMNSGLAGFTSSGRVTGTVS